MTTILLDSLALYKMNASQFQAAINLHTESITTRKQFGMNHKLIVPLVHQGVLMRKLGDYNQAIQYFNEASTQAINLNNQLHLIWINHHLAFVLLHQGEALFKAEQLSQQALKGYQQLEAPKGLSDCYEQQGFIQLAKGELEQAEKNFKKGLNLRKSIGNKHGTASSLLELALIAWHQKRYLKYLQLLCQSFYLHYQLGILNRVRIHQLLHKVYLWTLR